MGLFGTIAGSALGVGGQIFGGIKASQAMKKARKRIKTLRKQNEDWYDRRYNEDATQRADAQAILAQTEQAIRNRNRATAGAQAVTGGTDEATAAMKAANAQAQAQATSQIAIAGEQRKDNVEQQYQQKREQYANQLNNYDHQQAQNIAQAVQGTTSAGAALFGIDDDKKENETKPLVKS